MATTLVALEARVYAILSVDPNKEASGQYGESHVIAALNTAQRFIVKSATPASLGTLVKVAQHSIATPSTIGTMSFSKTSSAGGRLLAVLHGSTFADDVPIKSLDAWMATANTETTSSENLRSYFACEFGRTVYVRPGAPAFPVVFVEVYVDDPVDMVAGNSMNSMSLTDDWKEWLALCAAQIVALNARDRAKMDDITSLMTGWSAQFRAQFGANPPTIQAPVESGKVA